MSGKSETKADSTSIEGDSVGNSGKVVNSKPSVPKISKKAKRLQRRAEFSRDKTKRVRPWKRVWVVRRGIEGSEFRLKKWIGGSNIFPNA